MKLIIKMLIGESSKINEPRMKTKPVSIWQKNCRALDMIYSYIGAFVHSTDCGMINEEAQITIRIECNNI